MIEFEPPQGLLNSILLISCQAGCCSSSIEKVERILSKQEIDEELNRKNSQYKNFCELFGIDYDSSFYTIADLKEQWIHRDIVSLGDRIAEIYIAKIIGLRITITDFFSDELYQIVEIPWTFNDLHPGEQAIHYEIFTKREIFIRTEGDK
jgi:hypothetical protein